MVKFRCRLRTVVLTALIMGSSWFQVALADLNDGLVAYYPFNDNANDASSNGNHGTVNGAVLTEDRFGNADSAYQLDGNDYIEVQDNSLLDLTVTFTISLWINQSQAQASGYRLVDKTTPGVNDGYDFDTYDNSTGKRMRLTGGTKNVSANTVYSLNEWHYLVVTFSNGTSTFYLDGIADGSGNHGSSIRTNDLPLRIGTARYSDTDTLGFKGVMDDVRIYNRALPENEIQALYNGCEHATYSLKKRTLTVPFVEMPVIDFFTGQSTGEVELWTGALKQVLGVTNRFRLLSKTVVPITDGSSSSCPATYAVETGTLSIPYIDIPTGIAVGNKNFENGVNVFRATMTWEPMGKSFVVQDVQKFD